MKKIIRVVNTLAAPVVNELPFFTLFLLSISIQTLRFCFRHILYGQLDRAWEILSGNIPRAVVVAYIFTLLVYYSRSKAVKITGYVLASVLLVVFVFLYGVFRWTIQPDIIILLAETNAKESSEFVSAFLFTPGGIIALLSLVAYVVAAFFLEKYRMKLAMWGGGAAVGSERCAVRTTLCGTGTVKIFH